jgi:hypothetical protein
VPTFRVAIATATLAALAVPLVPTAAHATPVSPTLVFAADVNRDGVAGLYRAPLSDPTSRSSIIFDNGHVAVSNAVLSPDGNRIAVLADFNASSSTDQGAQTLVTMNLDGSNRHTLVSETVSSTSTGSTRKLIDGFAWKGSDTLVYGWFQSSSSASSFSFSENIRKVAAAGGTPSDVSGTTGMGEPTVSPDGNQIAAVDSSGNAVNLVVFPSTGAGADPTVLASEASTFLAQPAWSPDGLTIAFVRDESDATFDATQIDAVTFNSGTSSWNAATNVVPLQKNADASWFDVDPAWSSSTTLMFERIDDSSSAAAADPSGFAPIDLWNVTNAAGWSAPTKMADTPTVDEWSPTSAPADTTAPSAVTLLPVTLNGTSNVVRWTTPDVDYSHITLHRTDTTTTTSTDITGVFGTSYVDKGLTVGDTYSYTASTFDGAGNQAASDSNAIVATATYAPAIVAVTPTSTVYSSLPFRVTWGHSGQPAGTTYDVDYAVKTGSTWTLTAPINWLSGTTAAYATFTKGVPGQTYYFRAIVHDTHGNSSSTSWHGVNVPLDQKSGSISSGWVALTSGKYWLGSIDSTAKNHASFSIAPTAKSVSIIGTKCSTCGKFAVYVDGHYRATVSAASSTSKLRQVLYTVTNTTISSHRVTLIAVLGTHQVLQIDGVGDLR